MNKLITTKSEIKIVGLYTTIFVLLIFIINKFFMIDILAEVNFLNWDAEHYNWIKNYGYKDFRVAFFPLFPFIWKFSQLGIYGISILNSILFLTSFVFLTQQLGVSGKEVLLYLSIPSFMFFFLPYTESVFFASSTLLIIGIKKNNFSLIYIGLLLSTLARPAFTIFIPALIILELLKDQELKFKLKRIIYYILIVLIGLIVVGLIQYLNTGQWFKFFSAQKLWGNELQIPKLPFTSWAGGLIVRLDGTAMLAGLTAGTLLLIYILKIIKSKQKSELIPNEVLFSLAYLGGITLSVILFRGGSLFSLNRFVFATPFIIVITNYYVNMSISFSNKNLLLAFFAIMIYWLSFGSYVHIQALLKFTLLTIYIMLFLCMKSESKLVNQFSTYIFITINFTFFSIFFFRFLNNSWVG